MKPANRTRVQRKEDRPQSSYVGGWVSEEQKRKAQALAAIHGTSVQGLIRELIDRAAKGAQASMVDMRVAE